MISNESSGSTDDYGDDVVAQDQTATVCEIQQRLIVGEEPADKGEFSVTEWIGFFPLETEIDTSDAVDVPGLGKFEVVGAPWPARNPRTQQQSHLEVTLKRTAGAEDT